MDKGNVKKFLFVLVMAITITAFVNADVLILALNKGEFSSGESVKVFGYAMDDSYNGINSTSVSIYLGTEYESDTITDSNGYYEYYIHNISAGSHNVTANTSSGSQILDFTVFQRTALPSYNIIASSLVVPLSDTNLSFVVKKYSGSVLTNDTYSYSLYYENGSQYGSALEGISNTTETIALPEAVGLYGIVIDDKKSFSASVAQFNLKYKITDAAGNYKDVFKSNGIAYFRVEGSSNGQKISNATVTARVTNPSGTTKTVTFVESNGIYHGNSNVTQTTPITLSAGDYEVKFVMKDSSNNEQKAKGFFEVKGLNVEVDLVDKHPYMQSELAEFDVTVKNLENGNLILHNDTSYTYELSKDGKFYDVSAISASEHTDPSMTSRLSFVVPSANEFDDGGYFLRVKASDSTKTGDGSEFVEVMNTELFIDLSDNFGMERDIFKPGELAKMTIYSNVNLSEVFLYILDEDDSVQSTTNKTLDSDSGYLTFNVPTTQADYRLKLEASDGSGNTLIRDRWLMVQNYFSFLDVKDTDGNFKYVISPDESFIGEIRVFDIGTGEGVDISNFVVKFDSIINEETQESYENIVSVKNELMSDEEVGGVAYNITPPTLSEGPYRIEYTLVNTKGDSFKGDGWFGVSDFDVDVKTYDENGQQKEKFAAGDSINVSVELSIISNGTATIHREFFDPIPFEILNGRGSRLLTSAQQEIPSESGFYSFGVDIDTDDGRSGIGNAFFDIKNLNFRSINVRNNGNFASGQNIIADIVVEKSGELISDVNISLARLIRARDWQEISASSSAYLTSSMGRANITVVPSSALQPGEYFAEVKAQKANDIIYDGFGFKVVEDKVLISINDADNKFSSGENIEITVTVTTQNDTPINGRTVNLTGFLNLNTWAPLLINKQSNTSSTGIATMTVSASTLNAGRYAPILRVEGITNEIVGFGESEIEVVALSATANFRDNKESYVSDEAIIVDINVTGDVTVAATLEDMYANSVSMDGYYSSGVFTLNNDLDYGEYFLILTISQGTNSINKRLWFEILTPNAHIHPLQQPTLGSADDLRINYTVFTNGASGWHFSNCTLVIKEIENLWDSTLTPVDVQFAAEGESSYLFNLSDYGVSKGDYLLNIEMLENSEYSNSIYFRRDNNVMIYMMPQPNENKDNVTVSITTSGLSDPHYYLQGYNNYDSFTYYPMDLEVGEAGQANTEFTITGLSNGFYNANIRIEDGSDTYYWDIFFDIRVKEVTIDAPESAYINQEIRFNVSSLTSTKFWIIDQFTQNVIRQADIAPETEYFTQEFNYPGMFMYSYGNTKWEAYPNSEEIEITQKGFSVEWPYSDNRYVLTGNRNFTFNVTSDLASTSMTLKLTNIYTGNTTRKEGLMTDNSIGTRKAFSYNLTSDLGLDDGPHDVELVLEDNSSDKPRQFFFIDIYPDQYNIWAWTDGWEFQNGENVTVNIDIYDIFSDYIRMNPDSVSLVRVDSPFGGTKDASLTWTESTTVAYIQTDSGWATGNYHAEIEIGVGSITRTVSIDFFIRGNDNLNLFWNQDKWDYSMSDQFILNIDARDNDNAATGIPASLEGFEKQSDTWDEDPIDKTEAIAGSYIFSPENMTNSNGRVQFIMNLSETSLETGGYNGRINVGGQIVWFDFQLRSYLVDAYSETWEYGITDTIEINVRARDIDNYNPLSDEGNVTVKKIYKYDPGTWQPEEVQIDALGLTDNVFVVSDGEALIELMANQSALQLDQAYEFELVLDMNLSTYGNSEGWAWFRLSNTAKPQATVVDSTGSEPEAYFGGQNYTLKVTNVDSATLLNLWGPSSRNYDTALQNSSNTFTTTFIAPESTGYYTIEISYEKSGSIGYMYEDFTIGSGAELYTELVGSTGSIAPGVNFTVLFELYGEGDDPFCTGPYCDEHIWYGPLANETITFDGIKDLQDFSYNNLSNMNYSFKTSEWPESWLPQEEPDCDPYDTENECSEIEGCKWNSDSLECEGYRDFCESINQDEETCNSNSDYNCFVNSEGWCSYDDQQTGYIEGDIEIGDQPGNVMYTINPDDLGLVSGNKYDLVFVFTDDEGEDVIGKVFVQVEEFHVSISKREEGVGAKSTQFVWLKTAYLNGTGISGCNVTFDSIYNAKDYKLVRSVSLESQTNALGEAIFNYTAPSLPAEYLIEGTATCLVDEEIITQDIAYFIDVGAKSFDVDMKTKFGEDENIKISITTKDRLGNPVSQSINVNLFHERSDYPNPIYSLGGTDCVILDANLDLSGEANNWITVETDETGKLELELCPLPSGNYRTDIIPMFDSNTELDTDDKDSSNGYTSSFVVSSGDIQIDSSLTYMVGEEVWLNISATDEEGNLIDGSIIAMETILEPIGGNLDDLPLLYSLNNTINLTDGFAQVNYTISETAPGQMNESNIVNVTKGMVYAKVLISDELGNRYTYKNMIHVIVSSNESTVAAPSTIKTNKLVDVNISTDNLRNYKVQFGAFFQRDNTETMQDWCIENSVFLENSTNDSSNAHFKILSPKVPGSYYLAMPIFQLDANPEEMSSASEMIITPIEVTLDLVNATGMVLNSTGGPVEGAQITIGKIESDTLSDGTFDFEVPKGKYKVVINNGNFYMESDQIDFTQSRNINVSLYDLNISGSLLRSFFNITSLTNIETETKLNIIPTIRNDGPMDLTNAIVEAVAPSGKTLKYINVSSGTSNNVSFNQLYAGFKDSTSTLTVKVKANASHWNSTGYINISDISLTNATISMKMKKSYTVETYANPGDRIDNDNDGCIDEEEDNNKDDDNDGKIDEDLESPDVIEGGYCGDGICKLEEQSSCYDDCGGIQTICGDGNCDSGESAYCPDDCGGSSESCDPFDCSAGNQGEWCNQWGVITSDLFCDYCQWSDPGYCGTSCSEFDCWACSTEGEGSSECINAGCALGEDQYGSLCYYESSCSSNDCYACENETACSDTGACQWEYDPWSPEGGYCSLPWSCDVDCFACGDQDSCIASSANMTEGDSTVGCIWFDPDEYNPNGYCGYNFTHGGWEGREVKNFWISTNSSHEAWQASADFEGFSGNQGNVDEACYYIMAELGSTNINISLNDTFLTMFNGSFQIDIYATTDCYNLTNGTWNIMVEDVLGPDDFNWQVNVGSDQGQEEPEEPEEPGESNSTSVSLSGYMLDDVGSGYGGIIDGEICLLNQSVQLCSQLNSSSYNFTYPTGTYAIQIGFGDELNDISVDEFNLSTDTQMNFSVWDDSGFNIAILPLNPELTLDTYENISINISLDSSSPTGYENYSVSFTLDQGGQRIIDDILRNENFSISPGESYLLDEGRYYMNSTEMDTSDVEIFVHFFIESNDVVVTDTVGSIPAGNELDFDMMMNVTEA